MPWAKRKPCSYPGCTNLVFKGRCDKHPYPARQKSEKVMKRQRMYDHPSWRVQRKLFLRMNPLCAACSKVGIDKLASVVDHIIPHRAEDELFWNQDNWQPLCKKCHDRKTGRGE